MKLFFLIASMALPLVSFSEGFDEVYKVTDTIEIFHSPYYETTVIASTPNALRGNARWVLCYKDKGALIFKKGLPPHPISKLNKSIPYDCKWSLLFKDAKGAVIAELDFGALNDQGEFNGEPCVIGRELLGKLNNIAKGIDPYDDISQARAGGLREQ